MSQFTHNHVISWGIALITLSLVALFLHEGNQAKNVASVGQGTEASPSPVGLIVTPSPIPSRKEGVSMVTVVVTPTLSPSTMVTVALSPSLSPLSPRLSPSNNPAITIKPTLTSSLAPSTISPTPIVSTGGVSSVVINEIAWMGTSAGTADEWIELYNPGSQSVDVAGWIIEIAGDKSLALEGAILGGGYYLIERTDDSTVSNVSANLKTSFGQGLSNGGEELLLKNQEGIVIDRIGPGLWYAGDNAQKASMEHISASRIGVEASNWGTNDGITMNGQDAKQQPIRGTPGSRNSASR